MKKKSALWLLPALAIVACNQPREGKETRQYVLGSPEATVTTTPDTARSPRGPLAYAPAVPATSGQDTVDVKIDVVHSLFHVTRDVAFTAWMFGDTLPGPVLKVRVGQTIRFSMTDRSNDTMQNMTMHMNSMPMPHSIDFHAAMVNPADKYRSISPGETIHFTWTANYPGVFMYHCGTPMVLMHMIYGMVGMVIVEPREGFPGKVDKEFSFVQNEFYLKKQGSVYIPDTALARTKEPSFVTFNGKAAQYVTRPIHVKAGERVRVYLLNAGPNNATSFHVIGTIFDKVWLDGNPANELHGMQAVYLGPASGAVVEFVLPEKGRYTFVDHSFADAENGAIGTFVAE
ncbi:MAG TPA: multicopper oxidase domain-containing protein [Chitinophagaceae bacterium]|nr:multicopper oxidase domain-containing protein [Chitinophagaceae bacterium]